MMRRFWLAGAAVLPLVLSGCGGDDVPPPATFTTPDYSYLTRLRLNVGTIDVQNHSEPLGPDDLANQAPTPPAQALAIMARERLFPAGLTGQAVFTIDQASIIKGSDGVLTGHLAIHLEMITAGGTRGGYAEAQVSRQHVPGTDEENPQTVLYDMTNQMMADMNVELEFQIRRTVRDWLVTGAPVPSAVTATPLQPAAPMPPAPGAPPTSSIPGVEIAPAPAPPPDMTQPQEMSPPPGFLRLPPGQPPQ